MTKYVHGIFHRLCFFVREINIEVPDPILKDFEPSFDMNPSRQISSEPSLVPKIPNPLRRGKTIQWRENTTSPIVTGNISEHTGNKCNFYIFNSANFQLWKDNRNYDDAYVEDKIESLRFQFNPDKSGGDYYFVVSTPEPPQTRVAIFSATLEYERIRTKRLYDTVGNFLIIIREWNNSTLILGCRSFPILRIIKP